MEFEKEIEVISKLGTISDKLKYYNDNVSLLIGIGNFQHQVGFGIGREQYNVFCLCEQCEGKYSISDFETYRDIRNQETQKVVDFFESTNDYKTKIEYYFKISQGFSTTTRTLFFVPDKLDEINIHEFPYKISTIDITPKDTNEITILKKHLKQKLLIHESRVWISMSQFTFEKRVEAIEKYLKIRTEKNRREELIQSEYDKISLSKVDRSSKKPYDTTLFKILKVAEDIIQEKHNEFYTEFRKIEITILAEDTIKYEQYLNNLSLPIKEQQAQLSNEERNIIKLNQYYSSIKNVKLFKETILVLDNDLYYFERTKSFIENRNKDLLENEVLSVRIGWLKPFNSSLKRFLDNTIVCFKHVVEWKENRTNLHENTIEIRLSKEMEFFRMLPDSLRKNYDTNNDFLVLKMREYYINGFQMMIDFLRTDLMIDLEASPFIDKIQNVINDIKNAVDFESLKLALNYPKEKIIVSSPDKNMDNNNLMLDQIDRNLWNWLKNYEITNEYLSIPMMIEEKADYVIDTYKNYEERNFKYQLEICNTILEKEPNEKTIIEYKRNFEKKLIELRQQFPLPSKNIDILINEINNAFYRLEQFMKGKVLDYKSFLFNNAFTLLINELNKLENVNIKYDSIGNTYWYLMNQLDYAFDKGEFENQDAYKNEAFNRDSNEISYIQWNRMQELNGKSDLEDYQFELPSIIDIFNNTEVENKNVQDDNKINKLESTDNSNPYPRIFTSPLAYKKFINLLEKFGETPNDLANYSFVYHRMVKDKYIYDDYKQKEFVFFLLEFNINIDRIKPKTQLGNNDLRESIYNSLK